MDWIHHVDYTIVQTIAQHVRQDWLTTIVKFVTSLGNAGAIWLMIALILLVQSRTRRCGLAMLTALALGAIVGNVVLKNLIARPRPFAAYSNIVPLVIPIDPYSFPSGHTLSSFCAATACFGFYRGAGIACYILAAMIGLSRIYLGVHYPTDVAGGAVLGIVLGVLAVWMVNTIGDAIRFKRMRQ